MVKTLLEHTRRPDERAATPVAEVWRGKAGRQARGLSRPQMAAQEAGDLKGLHVTNGSIYHPEQFPCRAVRAMSFARLFAAMRRLWSG